MHKSSIEGLFILDLFNLDLSDIQNISYASDTTGISVYDITLASMPVSCPDCGCSNPKIKNYVIKKINHTALSDRKSIIRYRARRYICPLCSRTYYEHNPFVFKSMKISTRVIFDVLRDLKNFNETFSSVSRRYNISTTSAAYIFDSHVQLSRNPLPEVLNIDEVYAFKTDKSKYVCVLTDFNTQEPVDILPDRKYSYLANYLGSIPLEERKKVKIVCSDMYDTYRSITQGYFPSAKCAADPFHVSQEFHRKMDSVRIRVMKGFNKTDSDQSDAYYLLKHFRWLLFKSSDAKGKDGKELFDPNREKQYNHHFKVYLNYYELRQKILDLDTLLSEVYDLKLEMVDFYRNHTYETAPAALDELIKKFSTGSIEEMNAFGRTLVKWKNEIINSFIIIRKEYFISGDDGSVAVHDVKSTNALAENKNKVIKCIKHNANGYRNWYRFRNRVLYVLRPDATFHLEPLEIPWKKKDDDKDKKDK